MLNLRNAPKGKKLPPLILMTDAQRLPDPSPSIQRLPRGSAVILRHPSASERRRLALELLPLCHDRGILLLIAGDRDLACDMGADGIHLPEWMARDGRAVRNKGRRSGWIVTASAHGPQGLRRAAIAGADAALLSPVFPTQSHPGAPVLGPTRFAALCRTSSLPVYGLGGMTTHTATRIRRSGAAGIAAIGGLKPD